MSNNIGIIYALVAAVTWGVVYNLDQRILIKSSPMTMFFVGSIINIIVILPLYLYSKEYLKDTLSMDKTQFGLLFLSQIFVIVAGIAILYAVKFLDASMASVLEISYPFFVVIFSVFLFKETSNIYTWFVFGAIMMFIGGIFIIKSMQV